LNKKPIIVYWAPAAFSPEQESWNSLYQEPSSVSKDFYHLLQKGSSSLKCPAAKDFLHNVFSLDSTITNTFEFPDNLLKKAYQSNEPRFQLDVDSLVAILKVRENQINNYINLKYNMSWLFFAKEDLNMRYSAPYFPATNPIKDSVFAGGVFNIGKWFRPLNLEYYVPVTAKSFRVKEGEPLAFMEFETDRPIVFKRFIMNNKIAEMANESTLTSGFEMFKNLNQRYSFFSKTGMRDVILSEIEKNLV